MDDKEKYQIISEAREKYAEKINSLKFIEEKDSIYGPLGEDGLSIFRPHNITKIVDEIFHVCDVDYLDDDYREKLNSYRNAMRSDVLFGFKYRADEHIGYVLYTFSCMEPVILKSGRPSKTKTEEKDYAVVAAYNFYTNNIDVILLEGSERSILTPLVKADTPAQFYKDYKDYCDILEIKRRNEKMTITTGMWEDMQEQIRKLSNRIDELERDLTENYSRRYNSLED